MNTKSELIYLNNVLQRLCKLYETIQANSRDEEMLLEIKTKILYVYSEMMSIRKARYPEV